MDREQPRNPAPTTNSDLFAVRESNRASAYLPMGMLEPLKFLQSTTPSLAPEISVLSIPAVDVGPDDLEDPTDGPSPLTLPAKSPVLQDPSAEQSPTQSGSSPTGGNVGPAATSGVGAPAPPSHVASPGGSGNTSPAKPHHPTTTVPLRRGTRSDAPPVDWYQSISSVNDDRPIQEISQRILHQFPRQAHAQLLFTSADPAISTNRTVGKIASCLAQTTSGDVLLIDANWEANLTIAKSREKPQIGLAEILAQGFDWRPLVLSTQVVGLRVLPCGASDVPHRQINSNLLLTLSAEWRRDYAYVLINGGYVKQLLARRFAGCCDGAYVMVELNRTTKSEAQAASRMLAESKARTMGAIVFDTASDS